VDREDLRKNIQEFLEFIKNFEYYQRAMEISSNLYKQAIRYMQKDLENDKKKQKQVDESDEKAERMMQEENEYEDRNQNKDTFED